MPTAAELFQMMGKSPIAPWNIFGTIDQGLRQLNAIPQGQNEPDVIYRARQLTGPVKIEDDIRKGVEHYLQTPASRAAAASAPKKPAVSARNVFPEGFSDPVYDQAEANAARITGVPQDLLRAIRMRGERSNASAVSSAGARTPYQIIPGTAAGIKKNYGIDPLSNPENAALGAAYVLREQAGGRGSQSPNWADPNTRLRAVGGYFGGAAGANNPLSETLRDVNMSVAEYARNVLGEGLVSPFDLRYAQQALGQINQAHQAALTPQTLPFQTAAMPEPPQPKPVPKTDFSASESRLEALRPVEWTMKEAENTRWANFWGMLGKAMMSSPEGEGLGSFFLRLGGGALASVGMTRDEVQRRKDLYDDKMAKWNAALYEHDFQKAQVMQNELMADWQQDQNWAMEKYKSGMEVWRQTAIPSVVGNNLVSTHLDPATGKGTVTTTPIKSLVDAAYAMERSNVLMQTFGTENSANAQVAGVANRVQGNIVLAQAGQVLADQNASPQEKAAAAAFGPIRAINYAIDTGQIAGLLGEEETANLNEDIMKTLSGQGVFPGQKGYEEAYRNAATGRLLAYTMQSPETLERLMSTMAPAADLFDSYQRYSNRTERSITDSRGRSSHQITEEAPE